MIREKTKSIRKSSFQPWQVTSFMRMNIHNMLIVVYILVLIVKFWFGATFFMIKKDHFKCKMLLWPQVPFKNFAVFTSKHLCWRLFLIKLQTCNFIKKRLQHRYFPVNIAKFLRTSTLKNICERLLLILVIAQLKPM